MISILHTYWYLWTVKRQNERGTGDGVWHKEIIDKAKDACRAAFDRGDAECIRW
jgi:hypothetical protein